MVLLKIEIFPAPVADQPQSLTPSETHFASLSCSTRYKTDADQGRIWSLGRKEGDACIGADRSVSREHVVLSVATANKTLLDHISTPTSGNIPAPCTTPAQVEACKDDFDQMCILLQNVGKLGSFLVEEGPVLLPDGKAKQANDADDDSATANSEEVSQSQSIAATSDIPLSFVTQHFTQNNQNKVRLRPIGLNETVVLTKLSNDIHTEEQTISCANINNHKRVIVQCGKLGTTIIITRLHIHLVPCNDSKKHTALLSLLPWATGCKVTQQLPHPIQCADTSFPPTTYLVAQRHKAGTLNLEAWNRGIPLVSPDFVTALTGRSSPAAPWPDASEYPPTSDGNTFWTQVTPDPHLWSRYTLLVYHDHGGNDLERVILASGAKCVDLIQQSKANGEAQASLLEDVERLREIVLQHSNCVAVMDSRKGSQKIVQLLQKQLGVPCLTGKSVAKNLVAQSALLPDTPGHSVDGAGGRASPSKLPADSFSSRLRSSGKTEEADASMATAPDTTCQEGDSDNGNSNSKPERENTAVHLDDNMETTKEATNNQERPSVATMLGEKPKRKASIDSDNDDNNPQHSSLKFKKLKQTEPEKTDASLNEPAVVDDTLEIPKADLAPTSKPLLANVVDATRHRAQCRECCWRLPWQNRHVAGQSDRHVEKSRRARHSLHCAAIPHCASDQNRGDVMMMMMMTTMTMLWWLLFDW